MMMQARMDQDNSEDKRHVSVRVALAASKQKSVNAPLEEPDKEEAKVVPEEKLHEVED